MLGLNRPSKNVCSVPRVEVSLELLGQEGSITINARPGGDAKFLPLGRRPFKQTNKQNKMLLYIPQLNWESMGKIL